MWSIDELQEAWQLAADMHHGQTYGGARDGQQTEYLHHIAGVAFEILQAAACDKTGMDTRLAVLCAILHDTVEDTLLRREQIQSQFGEQVAAGVMALTKNPKMGSKAAQMADSLRRIKGQPREVWMVKLADRIVNLQAPPYYWKPAKIAGYREEARLILSELRDASPFLANRLAGKIEAYARFM